MYVNKEVITLTPNVAFWTDSVSHVKETGYVQVLIHFSELPTEEQKNRLLENGVMLMENIPDNVYTAIVKLPFNGSLSGFPVNAVINIFDEWKVSKSIWDYSLSNPNADVAVMASFCDNISDFEIRKYIKLAGGVIEKDKLEPFAAYKVILPAKNIKALAHEYCVKYISPVAKYANADVAARATVRGNIVSQPVSKGGYGLMGDSVTVGVGDDVAGIYHVDMADRVINYNPSAMRHHGVFTNGIIGSAGIVDQLAEGVAPHVSLIDHQYDNILTATGVMNKQYNMNVTNNSYVTIEGDCDYSGTYDIYAQFIDNLSLQYPNVLHVFAAGNDGLLKCAPYPDGFSTVAGGYQTAKNALVVTSTDKDFVDAFDASKGPVRDGRLKPELSAVGLDAYSCIDVTTYEFASGTSFASPHAAGGAALLTQKYKRKYGTLPNSDVLKAILLASATDIGNAGPDYIYGYGAMNLQHAMQVLDSSQYYTSSIGNSGQLTASITVPQNTGKLKVLLYWNDVASSPLASKQLVNDLDLLVQAPDATIHHPLILDPAINNLNNISNEGADHLNNSEEVVIDNPQAGVYHFTVNGYHVTSATQPYVVAYDLEPTGIKLTNPLVGTKVAAGQNFNVYWDAPDITNTFALQYSTDSGLTWNSIAANIPASQRYYDWKPDSTISSGLCLLKLSRNNTSDVSVSGLFVINPQPVIVLDSAQCPGYINIHWSAIPNATSYQVLRKKGPYMQLIDSTTNTYYSFLLPVYDSTYYVAVSPVINKMTGYRSMAVWRRPVDGNCIGFPAGDIAVAGTTLTNGRQFTSNQLTNLQTMLVTLRNLTTTATTNYSLAFNVNGGAWSTLFSPPTIPANGTVNATIPGLHLGTAGTYTIKVAVHNIGTTDPNRQNDTLVTQVKNINNPVISLFSPFTDSFETMPLLVVSHDTIGISPNGHWDYKNTTDSGRIRSYVNDSITISGNRSISLDDFLTVKASQNYFMGTFNLSSYDSSKDEVRMQFDYLLHGIPKSAAGNQVWARGADSKPWTSLYNYDLNSYAGTLQHSGSLSLTDIMLQNGQNYSASTQVLFGQSDTSVIAFRNYGNGMTIDNFTLYTVQNDAQLLGIVSPQNVNCGLGNVAPLVVQVRNGVRQTQKNILLFYQLDSGVINIDTLAVLNGKETINYTFNQLMNVTAYGKHTLNVFLKDSGDSYTMNDTILNYTFYNQPLINSYPYLENFEAGPGNWFTNGVNDSWQYGTPASPKIHKAASGTHAWKTNLTGNYNNLETSYLYSPCFDISQLNSPMLSFSAAMDIENCGSTLCDAGFIEYSNDGVTWTKLGDYWTGTNWYDSTFNLWNTKGNTRWHVASIPLPVSLQPIRLRFVLSSDQGAAFEGIAIDDVHIFERHFGVFEGNTPSHVVLSPNGNDWQTVSAYNGIITSINAGNQAPGSLEIGVYRSANYTNPGKTQYVFPRNFTIKAQQKSNDSLVVRLYILDKEMIDMLNATGCSSCDLPEDAYSLCVSKYDNFQDAALENGTLDDNVGGTYTFYPSSTVKWVPYDKGYYTEFAVKSFSEFWLSGGGPNHAFSVGDDYFIFNARKVSANQVKVSWQSFIDTMVSDYTVQRSKDGNTFTDIGNVTALHQAAPQYVYLDTPNVNIGASVFYRLFYRFNTGDSLYSPVRRVDWTDVDDLISMYPNPTQGMINIRWTANVGTPLQIIMTDEMGRTVYQKNIFAPEWNNFTTLETPRFASGVYFMRIILGSHRYEKKIVYK